MHLPSFYSGVFNHVYMYACKHACIHTCNIIRMYVHTCICPRFYSGVAPANASSSLHASVYARAVCLHLRTRWVRACEEHAIQASVPNGGVLTQSMIYTSIEHSHSAAAKLHKLVCLSDGMASDAAFARQLRRKFV